MSSWQINVLIVLSFVLSPGARADQSSCLKKELDQACQTIKKMNPKDLLDLGDGRVIPACMLGAVHSKVEKQYDEYQLAETTKLQHLLLQGADASKTVSPSFLEALYAHWGSGVDSLFRGYNDAVKLPWPPSDPRAVEKKVTLQDFESWYGAETMAQLKKGFLDLKNHYEYVNERMRDTDIVISGPVKEKIQELYHYSKTNVETSLKNRSGKAMSVAASSQVTLNSDYVKEGRTGCEGFSGMAINFNTQQVVGVGTSRLLLSDLDNVRSLAHEVSHNFDWCRQTLNLVRLKQPQGDYLFEQKSSDTPLGGDTLISACGKAQDYAFLAVNQCLRSEGGFTEKDLKNKITLDEKEACNYNFHNEAFSDWMGAKAVADYIKSGKYKTSNPVRAQFAKLSTESKTYELSPKLAQALYYVDQICNERDRAEQGSTHPKWEDRFIKIFAREPAIAEVLGCGQSETPPCSNSEQWLVDKAQKRLKDSEKKLEDPLNRCSSGDGISR